MKKANRITKSQQKAKNENTLLANEVLSLEKSISVGLKTIGGNLAFLQEILDTYDSYIDDIADNVALTEQQFKLSIEEYMDLSDYYKTYSNLLDKSSEDAQIKRVLLIVELEKEISKWIENNLDYLNKYLIGYTFYLKENVKIERYKLSNLSYHNLHVKVTFSIDIK